ncbi:hypothetical protein ACFX2I_015993 [Malus domestica]
MAEEYNKSQEHEYERKTGDYEEGSGAGETKDRGLFDFLGKKPEEKPASYQHEEKPASYQHEEKPASYQEEEVIVTEFDEKAKISDHHEALAPDQYTSSYSKVEEGKEKKHANLLQKLHRSNSSSSSSSDEEEDEEKKKQRKEKKGLKDKIKEKISGDDHKEEGYHKEEDTAVPVEKVYEEEHHHQAPAPVVHHHEEPTDYPTEEKKGFLEKIKEKLPGHKKTEEVPVAAASYEQQSHDHHATEPPVVASYEAGEEPKEKKGIMEKIKEKLPGYHSKTEEDHKDIKEKEKDTPSY